MLSVNNIKKNIINKAIIKIINSPKINKTWRGVKTAIPFVGVFGTGSLLYHLSPEFKDGVEQTRNFLNQWPRGYEMISSAFTIGFLPDLIAQRYEGEKLNLRRLVGMTFLGAITGGIIVREFYNYQNEWFPGKNIAQTVKKILVDQLIFAPLYFFSLYLPTTNLLQGRSGKGFFKFALDKAIDVVPKGWIYWGLMALPIIYNLPLDLMVYAQNTFSAVWFAIMSQKAYKK